MKTITLGTLVAVILVVGLVTAQSPDKGAIKHTIYEIGKSSLVKLSVTGNRKTGDQFNETGNGFYYETNTEAARILTARHVVGFDSEFDKSPDGMLDRRVSVTFQSEQFGAVSLQQTLRAVSTNPGTDRDVATIFADGKGPDKKFRLAKLIPKAGDVAFILSWPDRERAIQPPSEATVRARTSDDGVMVSLARQNGQFVKSESGAPVFNDRGAVIGILVLKANGPLIQPIGWLLPVAEFSSWLTDGVVGPTPSETADCINTELTKLRSLKPFSVEKSVRCENMGDSKSDILAFTAPVNYQIAGQVSRNDRTNYGSVAVSDIYDKDSAYKTGVRAEIACKTPVTPFGPGGWAGTILSGFIERIVTQEDMNRIGRQCRGE